MAQDTLVIGRIEQGARAIEAISAAGLDVSIAYWGRLADADQWQLYLGTPYVDRHGARAAYELVNGVLKSKPELGLELMDVRIMGLQDSLAIDAATKFRPRTSREGANASLPLTAMDLTTLRDCSLAGYEFDDVEIYPPKHPPITP